MNEQSENRKELNPKEPHPRFRRARRTLSPFTPDEELKKAEPADEKDKENKSNGEAKPEEKRLPPEDEEFTPKEPEQMGVNGDFDSIRREKTENEEDQEAENVLSGPIGVFDWIKSFIVSLAVVIFVFTLIFRGVTVSGSSMLPTLENGEYLIISDLLYSPEGGDIVVVQSPSYKNGSELLIKRIIATGGQTVTINFNTWQVWVDGVELQEDYILRDDFTLNYEDMTPDENGVAQVVVEEDCVFVMGDNRNDSLDSRSNAVGRIHKRYIMGRVILRVTPFDRFGTVD